MCLKYLTSFLFLFACLQFQAQSIFGEVLDKKTESAIPYAKIYCLETQNGVIADSTGKWQLDNMINNQMTLQISATDYGNEIVKVNASNRSLMYRSEIKVKLSPEHIHLDEVIISTSDSKLQRYSTFPVESRKITDLNKIEQTNIVDALSNIPGIYNFSTGNGIAKPVIRGLTGMRVLTSQNGLRLENQQWGADHGFAVLNLGIDRAEVIKGPSSLIYGADALGGVIYLRDEPYANANNTEIKASTKFESNSLATVNKISYKTSKNNVRLAVYGGYFSRSNYAIGKSSNLENNSDSIFALNSKNSGGSFKTAIGYNKNNWISNLRYQVLYFQNGLPGHTHAANPSLSDFLSNNRSRQYTKPAQKILNHLAQWENKFYFKNDELVAQLGFTSNELKEFEKRTFTPGIDMTLQNYSYNLRWKHQFNENVEWISGTQGMFQSNTNGYNNIIEILIEDAKFSDLGAFSLLKGNYKLWNIQAGVRYDQRSITTADIVDGFDDTFNGINYSAGISRSSKKLTTRLNASSGFRPPHISELLADGVHHATLQYLIGDANFNSERANQIDFYLGTHFDHLEIVINPFINQIDNYIYKNPTGNIDSVSGLDIFNMKQKDVIFSGGDIAIHYHPHVAHWLHLESNFSLLYTNNELPYIPQNRLNNIAKIDFKNRKGISSVSAQYIHFFGQNSVATYEEPSEPYQLINFSVNGTITRKNKIDYAVGVNNLLNTRYVDHLSRLKTYEIPNPGRNIYIKLIFQFDK